GAFLGGLCVLFARPLLSIYITDSENAISEGIIRMTVTCAPYFLCGIMNVLTGTIRGLGSSTITAINSLVGACGFRIFWVYCILPFNHTTGFLYLCWPFSWIFVIVLHLITLTIVKKRAFARMTTEE
ncbi:MAG: MATE family efflux transporter, partial [Clostridia bacterium]|nr:MATE family efflux transporter [Clostridia bacterium]